MPINCVYYTPEIRVYKNGDFERFNKTIKKWTKYVPQYGVLESSKNNIKIEGKVFSKKAIYDFCYDINKEIVKKKCDRIADGAFLRLNKFYD